MASKKRHNQGGEDQQPAQQGAQNIGGPWVWQEGMTTIPSFEYRALIEKKACAELRTEKLSEDLREMSERLSQVCAERDELQDRVRDLGNRYLDLETWLETDPAASARLEAWRRERNDSSRNNGVVIR